MNETKYLTPDYFPDFHCKMGACRSACCEGWPISFTMTDYFNLLGVECSPQLRRKIDGAMHLADHPSPDAYAQISPRYDGQCPMRMEDGRCALHAELGEDMLAAVCRLYPRGVRTGEFHECSCANSCEAVVELLLYRQDTLKFIQMPLDFSVPEAPRRQFHFETAGREQEIRLWLISHIQNRAYPLQQRLALVGEALLAIHQALTDGDHRRIEALLSGEEQLPAPATLPADEARLLFGLKMAGQMLEIMDERSDSIREYGETALRNFREANEEYSKYISAEMHFRALVPQWETWFEHLLVNHMFFSQFPFQDRPVELKDEFIALCAVYTLLRFLCIGCAVGQTDETKMVDVVAAAFRLIDHTDFDRYAAPILKRLGCASPAELACVLCL